MKTTLSHIASIRTGLFDRPQPKGEIVYLQFRHFDADGALVANPFPDLKYSKKVANHLLQPGDVLFAAKGSNNFATTYMAEYPAAVASSSFFVISVSNDTLLPEFLAWTLNSSSAQEYFKSKARGSGIPSVTKQALEDLIIPLPPMETQRMILHIDQLKRKELDLYQQLSKLRDEHTQHLLSKYLNNL